MAGLVLPPSMVTEDDEPLVGESKVLSGFQRVLQDTVGRGLPGIGTGNKRMLEFIEEDLHEKLWSKQKEIVDAIDDHRYVSIASGHGIGKSFTMALVVLAFIHTRANSIVLTTAPTGYQVENILWEYIRGAHARHRDKLKGRMLNLSYTMGPGWKALGFKPADNETDRLQGFHAPDILTIIDEAAGVQDSMIDVLHATMTSAGAHFVMVGNPTSISGRFRESHHKNRNLYHTISISVDQSPNFTGEWGDDPISGLTTPEFVQEEIDTHGLDSDFVQARVFAKWPKGSKETLIGLDKLEAIARRGFDEVYWEGSAFEAGFDVARFGDDASVLTIRQGMRVYKQVEWRKQDTDYSIGRIREELEPYGGASVWLKIDEGGMGAGVLDGLRHQGYRVAGVNFGGSSSDLVQWPFLRHELYWMMKQIIDDGEIAGEVDPKTIAQLSDIRFTYDRRHTKPIIEDKADVKKRRGFSPDHAESLMLAFYQAPQPAAFGVESVVGIAARSVRRRR